jgi:hypothetical protein
MKSANFPVSRKENIVVQELNDETLIYDLRLNRAFCLNRSSKMVWDACDGKTAVSEIAKVIKRKTGSLVDEDFVWLALDGLRSNNLLAKDVAINFGGLSRREVIKRVGRASVVAIPLVTGIFAPRAAHALSVSACRSAPGSGLNDNGTGCPCTSAADCCGFCSANVCAGANNVDSAPICFGIVCASSPGSGQNDNVTGCPCTSAADCCGFCSANVCAGANNADSAPSCP